MSETHCHDGHGPIVERATRLDGERISVFLRHDRADGAGERINLRVADCGGILTDCGTGDVLTGIEGRDLRYGKWEG